MARYLAALMSLLCLAGCLDSGSSPGNPVYHDPGAHGSDFDQICMFFYDTETEYEHALVRNASEVAVLAPRIMENLSAGPLPQGRHQVNGDCPVWRDEGYALWKGFKDAGGQLF